MGTIGLCYLVPQTTKQSLTLAQVVVFPLPCSPTTMMMLAFPLTGCHIGVPGSNSVQSLLDTKLMTGRADKSSKSTAALEGVCVCVCVCVNFYGIFYGFPGNPT